jgi:hypothetical protein
MRNRRFFDYRLVLVLVVLAGAALIPMTAASRSETPVREIRLVARQMTYYLEGSNVPNPTLLIRRGEQVRIVLRNDDPGLIHDLGIDAWRVRTELLDDKGASQGAIQFQAPDGPAETSYSCTPHGQMMRGTIRVE